MPPASSKVKFFFDEVCIHIKDRGRLKVFVEDIFRREKKRLNKLNYVFCSDTRLLSINREYLGHDYYTDIISFDLSENANAIIGEVYISADRVRENAAIHNVSVKRELHRVIFHGALHLCGYKDKTQTDKERMRKKEDHYLAKYSG